MFRKILMPLSLIIIAAGILLDFQWLFIGAGIILLVWSLYIYSSRKSRVRYWLQDYKISITRDKLSHESAVQVIKDKFNAGKYADESITNRKYEKVDNLVFDIISKEFKFSSLLSGNDMLWGFNKYQQLQTKLDEEIKEVKLELNL